MTPRAWRDRIARRAAEFLAADRAQEIGAAIARAAADVRAPENTPFPTAALVRKHAQGMALQALGEEAYRTAVRAHLEVALALMQLMHAELGAETLLTGRAAKGQLDADPTLHIRVYTRTAIGVIAQTLLDAGYDEPEFVTVETRHGRANQVKFTAGPARTRVVLLRCLPEWKRERRTDLVTGKPVASLTLDELSSSVRP